MHGVQKFEQGMGWRCGTQFRAFHPEKSLYGHFRDERKHNMRHWTGTGFRRNTPRYHRGQICSKVWGTKFVIVFRRESDGFDICLNNQSHTPVKTGFVTLRKARLAMQDLVIKEVFG
jgi:hypothetical protein